MGLALSLVFVMMRKGVRPMKKFMLAIVFAMFALGSLPACTKDDLSNVDIKVDGSMKTTMSTGSRGFGAGGSTRVGVGF